MDNIYDIYQKDTILEMIPLIETYFKNQLGIEVLTERNVAPEVEHDSDRAVGYHYRLRTNGLDKQLDPDKMLNLLFEHFVTVIAEEKPEDLIRMQNYIENIKSKYLTFNFISQHPEGNIVVRFTDGLYVAVIHQLAQEIYQNLSKPLPDHANTLLMIPKAEDLKILVGLITKIELHELLNFKIILEKRRNDLDPDDHDNDFAIAVQDVLKKINIQIRRQTSEIAQEADITILTEKLPTLQSQIHIKKILAQNEIEAESDKYQLYGLLDIAIKSTILELLNDFEKDVHQTYSDRHKEDKLRLITDLRAMCQETADTEKLYQTIHSNEKLLTSTAIGRYLYDCICWLLNIQNKQPNYSQQLFKSVGPSNFEEQTDLNHKNQSGG
ncbi:MAG: hypothetical protein NXI01_00170 [Gammaproteobacteria bacterium]|nr:hypothetical protein [Gammaproteobacteria bacterium]